MSIWKGIENGDLESVKQLLTENPRLIREENVEGMKILHFASMYGYTNITQFILEFAKAQKIEIINERANNRNKWTALFYACTADEFGFPSIVDLLLKNGGEMNISDESQGGKYPIHYAAKYGNEDIVNSLLIKGAKIDALDKKGNQAIREATLAGHLSVLVHLVKKGANINYRDAVGNNLLHLAAVTLGNTRKFFDFLLDPNHHSKLNFNMQNNQGDTPLMLTTKLGLIKYEKIISVILEYSPDLSITNKKGFTFKELLDQERIKLDKEEIKDNLVIRELERTKSKSKGKNGEEKEKSESILLLVVGLVFPLLLIIVAKIYEESIINRFG